MNRDTIEKARKLAETNKQFREMVFNDPNLFDEIYGDDGPGFSNRSRPSNSSAKSDSGWEAPTKYKKNTDGIIKAWMSSLNKDARPYAVKMMICFVLTLITFFTGIIGFFLSFNSSDFNLSMTIIISTIVFSAFFLVLTNFFNAKLESKELVPEYRALKNWLFDKEK